MNFLSVCSGIEAASVAWKPLGWKAVAYSEIEPFPCAVLAHHYPDTPNWGDMTKFKEWPDANIDLLCGGTPCQSFSVAGLRKGLEDPRGNLMLTYLAIAGRYRPKWLVWENVPGVLSSNGGKDFGAFLGGLAELGYGFAYRVLDAQYFGVAQRRRRVFVVGCIGDWRAAAAVLFERDSLSGHPAPRREKGEVAAKCLTRGANQRYDYETEDFITYGIDEECNVSDTPSGPLLRGGQGGTRQAVAFVQNSRDEVRLMGGDGKIVGALAAETGAKQQCYVAQSVSLRGRDGGATAELGDEIAGCLRASTGGGDKPHVLASVAVRAISQTLTSNYGKQVDSSDTALGPNIVFPDMQVRRLTPVECERLQGFPENYTNIKFKGKPVGDGHRYKALGNSWAVPCARWIGKRISAFEGTIKGSEV